MSASILTNNSAMAALQTLQSISEQLDTTQNQISSGLRVGSASDNAAYWSIATTMKSDNKALSAVSDALGLGSSTVDTAYTGMNSVIDNLNAIKADLVTAQQPGVDKSKIQADIDAQVKTIQSIAKSASFSGSNWLDTNGSSLQSVVSSLSRDSNGQISLGTISVNTKTTALFDTGGEALLQDVGTSGSATSDAAFAWSNAGTTPMDDGSTISVGVTVDGKAQTVDVKVANASTFSIDDLVSGLNQGLSGATASKDASNDLVLTSNSLGSTSSIALGTITLKTSTGATSDTTIGFTTATATAGADTGGFGVTGIDVSNASQGTLSQYMQGIDKMISNVTDAASSLGATKTEISSQTDFVKTLMDTIDSGVGTLVDADMNQASTKLKALQTQQQLGIQALSIANSNSSNILSLFR